MSFLSDILQRKRAEVLERRRAVPLSALQARAAEQPAARSLFDALSPPDGPLRVIAEIKRSSPSAGPLHPGLDAPAQAVRYAQAGAAAISVLTDGPGFGGSLEDLGQVRSRVSLPLLRKDFLVDPYQLYEARAFGADAVLLIVAALSDGQLMELAAAAQAMGLDALVEVHDEAELERALEQRCRLVGVNNRDLATFQVDLGVCERLLPRLPGPVRSVAESGVKGPAEASRLRRAGAANLLVGEGLVRADDPAEFLRRLSEAP